MKKTYSPRRIRYRTQLYLKRNSSTVLTCIGAVGVIVTAVSTAMATPKALQKLSRVRREKKRKLTKMETFVIAAPNYITSIALGASTIICIFGANTLSRKRQAALTSAYAMLNESFKEYRAKLIELHGEEADEEVRDAIVRDCHNFHQIGIDIPDGKVLFVEPISGEVIECFEREIMDAEYHLNRNFVMRGYAPLNEFYEFLGLPQTDYGQEIGWTSADGYCWIDFEHHPVNVESDDYEIVDFEGRKATGNIYEIVYIFQPDADYLREWE